MKNVIAKISKTSVIKASLFAIACAIVSNYGFNFVGECVAPANVVDMANNVVDVAQLALYIAARLYHSKKLTRFDVPFIAGGLVAIFS